MPLRPPVPSWSGRAAGRRLALFAALAAVGLGCGCQTVPKVTVDWKGGPFFSPTNFSGVPIMPSEVRRVAVLPVAGLEGLPPDTVAAVESAVQGALLAEGRFETVAVDAALVRALAGKPTVNSGELLPPTLLERVARETGAEAVLFVDVTLYRPYAPMALGVRAKLARCDDARALLWAFDTLYDVRDPAVGNSARRHAAGGRDAIVDAGPSALQSPGRFAAYVFSDVFGTLPKRPPPVPPPPTTKVSR